MSLFRKKTWRRFPKASNHSHYIRFLCVTMLTLELAFFAWERMEGEWYRVQQVQEEETAAEEETGPERLYGIRFRLEEGEIQFYRQDYRRNDGREELKSTN